VNDPVAERSAVISDCGTYRYSLTRRWAEGPRHPLRLAAALDPVAYAGFART